MIGIDLVSYREMLAQRVRKERLARNFTQTEMAARCAMSLPAYQRFETTGKTALGSFIKILAVLYRLSDLRAILAEQPVTSLEEFETRIKPQRMRARKPKAP